MRISQDDLMRRLGSKSNLVNKLGLKETKETKENESKRGNDQTNRNNCGRLSDKPNAPESLRKVASILSNAENNSSQVARNLHLTPGQVTYAKEVFEKETKITEKQVEDLALTRLMDTLGLLDPVCVAREKPKDISTIAANLSRVHSNLRAHESNERNNVSITIYSPKQRDLKDYETIEVSASA